MRAGRLAKPLTLTEPATEEARRLDGSYAGFQPKPAVEVIIVAMKPMDEKNYTDQALSNGKGITWLDDCRIPYKDEKIWSADSGVQWSPEREWNSDCSRAGNQKDASLPICLFLILFWMILLRFFSLDAWADFNIKDLPEQVQRNLPF